MLVYLLECGDDVIKVSLFHERMHELMGDENFHVHVLRDRTQPSFVSPLRKGLSAEERTLLKERQKVQRLHIASADERSVPFSQCGLGQFGFDCADEYIARDTDFFLVIEQRLLIINVRRARPGRREGNARDDKVSREG